MFLMIIFKLNQFKMMMKLSQEERITSNLNLMQKNCHKKFKNLCLFAKKTLLNSKIYLAIIDFNLNKIFRNSLIIINTKHLQ